VKPSHRIRRGKKGKKERFRIFKTKPKENRNLGNGCRMGRKVRGQEASQINAKI